MNIQPKNTFTKRTVSMLLAGLFFLISLSGFCADSAEIIIKKISVNGTTLHYKEKGEGETLIMVHGSMGSLNDPNEQFDEFAKKYHVISYSRRFHPPNKEPMNKDLYTLEQHTEDLAALIVALDEGAVHLIGHSYGAYILLSLAIKRPELVNSLILAEPPAFPLASRSQVGKALMDTFSNNVLGPTIQAFEKNKSSEAVKTFLYWVSGSSGWFEHMPEENRKYLMSKAPEFRLEVMTDFSLWMPTLDWNNLLRFNRPVLLLSGDRSPALFYLVIVELEKLFKNERFEMVSNAGHMMISENPSLYNKLVLDFLEETKHRKDMDM